MLLECTNICHW